MLLMEACKSMGGFHVMTKKLVLKPGPKHPITIQPLGRKVVVHLNGQVIAESENALELKEAQYPTAIYIPRSDANMNMLERSAHNSYCPYKGDASYYSIPAGGAKTQDAVWTYETPFESVTPIKDHLAFYPDKVEIVS